MSSHTAIDILIRGTHIIYALVSPFFHRGVQREGEQGEVQGEHPSYRTGSNFRVLKEISAADRLAVQ